METIDHVFFYCVYSWVFWGEFESYWFAIAKEQRKLELSLCVFLNLRYSSKYFAQIFRPTTVYDAARIVYLRQYNDLERT